ncbi:UDP-N-acetylmuramate dehydrogenase [bacterium]|nr:UDP-N-acetylmuramate dehydrogenase [bacterium]
MSTKSSFEARSGHGKLTPQSRAALETAFQEHVRFNEPLAPYVAYGIGGPADVLVFPRNGEDLQMLAQICREYDLPVTIIGTGTNLLVLDAGIRGVVIALKHSFNQIEEISKDAEGMTVRCGAGVSKPELLEWAISRGYAGLEFSSGVPGTLGGGIFMNAGTKYGCYADILTRLELFDFEKGLRQLERKDLYFGYREQTAVGDSLVTSMDFRLKNGDAVALRTEVQRIIQERAEKQPLDFPSCGSTFKNPPTGMSAGRLIEHAGLKGSTSGGAEISLKHANFFLNKGGARASDILALIDLVKKTVFEKFQVQLECEVIILGDRGSL